MNRLKRTVFDQLEHIVVVDSVMTDTACYSDLVLPVAQWFEFGDITGGGQTNFYTGFNEKAIEPLHESKTDSDIARLIAEKMGLGEYFTETDAEILDDCYAFFGDVSEAGIVLRVFEGIEACTAAHWGEDCL